MPNEETAPRVESSAPNVWLVRGGKTGEYVKALVSSGYWGFRFELAHIDFSRVTNEEEIRALYLAHRDGVLDGSAPMVESEKEIRDLYLRQNAASPWGKYLITWFVKRVSWFVFDVKSGDYVVMPEASRTRVVHYGTVRSDVYHVKDDDGLPFRNRRTVAWQGRFTREDKPALRLLCDRNESVWPVNRQEKLKFFEVLLGDDALEPSERARIQDIVRAMREQMPPSPAASWDPWAGAFLEPNARERMLRLLQRKQNLILQGPPGVGKTFLARRLAYALLGARADARIRSVQFHQSYAYEDFVGGYRPQVRNGQLTFEVRDGAFVALCNAARKDPQRKYVMLIDEINRGNLSRVFGELLLLLEPDKRNTENGVALQHQDAAAERFWVPANVYVIGTMNLADRSLTGMNVAMRRRFGFQDLAPQFGQPAFRAWLAQTGMPENMQNDIHRRLSELNRTLANDPSLDQPYAVGHSFFCPSAAGKPAEGWEEWYAMVVEHEIRPLLAEYWFDNPEKAERETRKLLRTPA